MFTDSPHISTMWGSPVTFTHNEPWSRVSQNTEFMHTKGPSTVPWRQRDLSSQDDSTTVDGLMPTVKLRTAIGGDTHVTWVSQPIDTAHNPINVTMVTTNAQRMTRGDVTERDPLINIRVATITTYSITGINYYLLTTTDKQTKTNDKPFYIPSLLHTSINS